MDFWFYLVFGVFCGIAFVSFQIYINMRIRKKREDEYFRRMYWTMRQAREDSKQDKDKYK